MNEFINFNSLFLLSIISMTGIALLYTVLKKEWKVSTAILFIFFLALFCHYKSVSKVFEPKLSTVPTLDSITNGLYRVMATYSDGAGGHLTVVHRQKLVTIDTSAHKIETSQVDPSPVLLRTTSPILLPGTTNIIRDGLIEIGTDAGVHFAREYNPFRYLK